MFRPGGYAIITDPNGVLEMDTFTCSHHNGIVHVPAGTVLDSISAICFGCQKRICRACEKRRKMTGRCDEWERQMDALEKQERIRQSRDAFLKVVGIAE